MRYHDADKDNPEDPGRTGDDPLQTDPVPDRHGGEGFLPGTWPGHVLCAWMCNLHYHKT